MAEEGRRGDELYRRAFRASPGAVAITRLRDGRLIEVNDGFVKITGFSRAEALGKTTTELGLWSEQDRGGLFEILEKEGKIYEWPRRFRLKSGELLDCLMSAEREEFEGESVLVVVVRDVTDQVRIERELKASEEKFAKAFRSSPDAITISRLRDGLFLDVNDGFEQLSGYRREDAVGHRSEDLRLWTGEDRRRIVEQLRAHGRVRNQEVGYRMKSGEIRDFLISAEVFETEGEPCMVAISRDVHEQNLVQRELRASEEKFAKIFHSSPDAIMLTTGEDGTIVEVNEGFELHTGFGRDEALGKTTAELGLAVFPGGRGQLLEQLRQSGKVRDLEIQACLKSGEVRDCLMSADMIEIGGQGHLLTITRDVSDSLRHERERDQLIEALAAQNEELERFAYTVSHDLRSPLVTIQGFLGYLEGDIERGNHERIQENLAFIKNAASKMDRLLIELLELSRIGRVINPPKSASLADLVGEAVELVRGQLEEKKAVIEIDSEMPSVWGDRVRLVEVFQNLIENSVRFSGDRAPRIEIGARSEAADTLVWVRDHGRGIDSRYLDKIWGLFERLEGDTEGSGVGLALVQRIVEMHGGTAWAESEGEGHGTTVFFRLPEPSDDLESAPRPEPASRSPEHRTGGSGRE